MNVDMVTNKCRPNHPSQCAQNASFIFFFPLVSYKGRRGLHGTREKAQVLNNVQMCTIVSHKAKPSKTDAHKILCANRIARGVMARM